MLGVAAHVGRCVCGRFADIYKLVNDYREQYALPALKVQFHAKRGWFLTLPSVVPLADLFVQVTVHNRKMSFTTHELSSLSDRNKEAQTEIILMTER